ncbi:sigma54 specific transcriptional regulator, Fis family [Alkaliphilus metalliredigens QYMF]|uniref:Sigma54 specific transcriptional regulator, Fis family n=1 Tax=Alkaliphilus metalliredigens (strain QYMF) TaxID=293826 RepID=A6TWZ7_ALKMQ|nr:sigma-54-dependent Fis family transcriptional regulator [Alkaliphilus metalliredigens]ABR50715.1 sigma54 specific transcriptional regulator, Fis family [Alkaliphilus metalliredigens QYMF]
METKDYVKRSHQRSIDFGVEYNRMYSSKILKGNELQIKLEANRELLTTAKSFMEELYNFVEGSGFFAILTDQEGCILEVLGDDKVLAVSHGLEMIPGAYMDEEHIGTNAMGTALAEGIPVQISGEEHFVKAYHRWTCSAAPIRNSIGEAIGTLNLTGYSEYVHSHTLGMVAAAANAIAYMLESKEVNNKLFLAKKSIETIVDSIDAGIFTVGPKGYMKTINQVASHMLQYTNDEILGMEGIKLIEGWAGVQESVESNISYVEEEAYIKTKKGKIHCTLSAYPILDESKNLQGIVCMIREIKKMRRLVNKMIGKQALYTFDKIIGRDENFIRMVNYAKKISDSPSTVLIMGESGTGKEVFAQSIHNHSERRDEPFVAINCGALPRNLIESELFGYEDGAFTGAKRGGHPGKFELADGGTLFLDEIGEMPLDMQANLLRVLEEGKLFRVGGNKEIAVDVRIIAATNKDLRDEVERNNFRGDLYYRLNVLPLILPPLRERKSDIPLLIDYFMTIKALKLKKSMTYLPRDIMDQMINYTWRGNIRELENVIENLMNSGELNFLERVELSSTSNESSPRVYSLESEPLEDMEKRHIHQVLTKYEGNVSQAAEALGIGRNTLYRKMAKYKIDCSKMTRCSEVEHENAGGMF